MRAFLRYTALAFAVASSGAAFAAVDIGTGVTVDLADAAVDFGCSDFHNRGALQVSSGALSQIGSLSNDGFIRAGAARIDLGGNLSNSASFDAGASRVSVTDACGNGTSQFAGSTSFYDLTVSTFAGKRVVFPAGQTQKISHAIVLKGAAGNLLTIASDTAGQRGILDVATGAAQAIDYVSAGDNEAAGAHIAPGAPTLYHSVDQGNLINWFGDGGGPTAGDVEAAPTLGMGKWLLLAGLLVIAWRKRRPHVS